MNKENLREEFIEFLITNKGKFIGALLGFVFAIIFLTVGFFKTTLILICTLIGILIGSKWNIDGNLRKILNKLLPPQFK